MRTSLPHQCARFLDARDMLRRAFPFAHAQMIPICAGMAAGQDRPWDAGRLYACRDLIQEETGLFSNFRGAGHLAVITLLALSPAPEERMAFALQGYKVLRTRFYASQYLPLAALLLDGLHELGLEPQVIPGEVEARLTFFGVAHDFAGERIVVADSGGGSTELATGVYAPERGVFALEGTRSLDIGCRRVTERFFSALPPSDGELAAAADWAGEQFEAYFESLPSDFERAERLVAVGGTVTTLVALVHELEPYDSSFVHLRELSMEQISDAIDHMSTLDVEGIAALPGVQPKRAGVILAGAVVIRELMRAGGYKTLTVSENSLLAGMAATINEVLDGATPTIAWTPSLSAL